VRLNGEKILDTKAVVRAGSSGLFQVGKRVFAQIAVSRD